MSKKFLTLNIGASTVSLAEYEGGSGSLTLVNYGTATLAAPLDSGNAEAILTPALLEIVREKGIKPGHVSVSVSGQMVFPRFAAIPAAGGAEKFEQMVRYEIEQNIPFPIDEMICDRQVLGDTAEGDKSVLIVAAKVEQIEAITAALQSSGFEPDVIDVAPIALTNAFRANRPDETGCTVMLDIGYKTTSLVIIEGDKFYNRSIPVAGYTVTKELASALGVTLEEAETIKRENAYVSLGGVTEDEDETLDRISKVCRAVLTRLHAEISRSINFYRSQQGGGTPVKLYVTGGSALLPQLAEFFQDSLQLEVEFFNPFEAIGTAPSIDAEALGTDAAFLAPTAGLALHAAGMAPIAINLMPGSILDARAEVRKIPFVAVGSAALVAAFVCLMFAANHAKDVAQAKLQAVSAEESQLKSLATRVKQAEAAAAESETEAAKLRDLLAKRSSAVTQVNAVRQAIGDDMWIDRWQEDKAVQVTIRGWKDRVDLFVEKAVAKSASREAAAAVVAEAAVEGAEAAAKDEKKDVKKNAKDAKKDAKRNAKDAKPVEAAGDAAKPVAPAVPRTAPEIVASRLRLNPAVVPESVKVKEMTSFGKEGCVVQFTVELKFK